MNKKGPATGPPASVPTPATPTESELRAPEAEPSFKEKSTGSRDTRVYEESLARVYEDEPPALWFATTDPAFKEFTD